MTNALISPCDGAVRLQDARIRRAEQLSRVLPLSASSFDELANLSKSIDHIKEIVATQQSYAGPSGIIEPVQIAELVEEAMRMSIDSLSRDQVKVVREFGALPHVLLDKQQGLQILLNLISNAKQVLGSDFVLLTPKDILTKDEAWINRADFLEHFQDVYQAMPNEQLRAQVNEYFLRSLSEDAGKEEIRRAAANAIEKFPEVLDHCVKLKEDSGAEAHKVSDKRKAAVKPSLNLCPTAPARRHFCH